LTNKKLQVKYCGIRSYGFRLSKNWVENSGLFYRVSAVKMFVRRLPRQIVSLPLSPHILIFGVKPYALVSLSDMEQYYAHAFYQIARCLEALARLSTKEVDDLIIPSDDFLERDSKGLKGVAESCALVGLTLSTMYAQRMSETIAPGKKLTFAERAKHFTILQDRIQDEMSLMLVMRIPQEQAELYDKAELFGKNVNARFPTIQFDVVEAGNCYATGRSTAVVFHLMRIMETGVQEFGTKLGVKLVGEKNWQNILDEINKAIRALPPKDPTR
jgi:hypothetical protein